MNKGQGHWTDNSIRGDYIAWLNDPIKNQVTQEKNFYLLTAY
jgi:hypothetical protein